METKANHILIGAFILLATFAGFGFVFWIQNYGAGSTVNRYYVLFKGPVTGLVPASQVLFNGLKVGKIEDFKIDPDDPRNTKVLVTVRRDIPVRKNSFARIVTQGLSPYASVMITPGTPDEQLLTRLESGDYPVIKAAPGGGGSLFESAPQVLNNANTVLRRIDELVANNEQLVRDTLRNVEAFTKELDRNKGRIASLMENADKTVKDAGETANRINRLLSVNEKKIDDTIGSIAVTAKNAESFSTLLSKNEQSIEGTIKNIEGITKELDRNKGRIASLMENADKTVKDAGETANRLNRILSDNEQQIEGAIGDIAKTAKNTQSFTAMLATKEQDIAATIDNVREISTQFKGVAAKLETTLDGLSGFLGDENGESMMTEISQAARSFKSLAEKLDKSLGGSADGMARFATNGLREFELLMREGRRMVKAMERVMNKIERNPQGLIFGSKQVREYKSN